MFRDLKADVELSDLCGQGGDVDWTLADGTCQFPNATGIGDDTDCFRCGSRSDRTVKTKIASTGATRRLPSCEYCADKM